MPGPVHVQFQQQVVILPQVEVVAGADVGDRRLREDLVKVLVVVNERTSSAMRWSGLST